VVAPAPNATRRTGADRRRLAAKACEEFGAWVDDAGFAVATADELLDDSLKDPAAGWLIPVATDSFSGRIRLVDRRIVGADWLRRPSVPARGRTPRLVFASLKGGVGRSTALCVLAADLAARGQRVLAIDLDLEAPGLGVTLLTEQTLPAFGLLDYLVESQIGQRDDAFWSEFIPDLVAASWLGERLAGSIAVIPVLGGCSRDNPLDVLAKLARAYLERTSPSGGGAGVAERLGWLLDRFDRTGDYDAILIDARAGLHETAAAAILGLGAEVLLFAGDQPQTLPAFTPLFAHLANLMEQGWAERLHIVQSKAPLESDARDAFGQRMLDAINTWSATRDNTNQTIQPDSKPEDWADKFDSSWSVDEPGREASAAGDPGLCPDPCDVLAIAESFDYRVFDPVRDPDQLTSSLYQAAFGPFLNDVRVLLETWQSDADDKNAADSGNQTAADGEAEDK